MDLLVDLAQTNFYLPIQMFDFRILKNEKERPRLGSNQQPLD